MGMLLSLALRNTMRNRRRTLFTLASLLLGVGFFVAGKAFVDGFERTLVATEIDAEHGHLRVAPRDWMRDEDWFPLDIPFPEAGEVAALLRARGARVRLRTAFLAEVGDGRRALTCRGLVVPPDYGTMFRLGDLPVPAGDEPFAWLGVDLARAFGLRPGDTFFLKARNRKGSLDAIDGVRVAGLLSTSHPLVDDFTVFLPERVGRVLLDLRPGDATEVLARFEDPGEATASGTAITSRWPRLAAETWRQKTQYLIDMNRIRRRAFLLVVAVILLIGAASVANTCLMAGFERTREVGTLLALGFGRGGVLALFLLESAVTGLAGSLLGLAVGGGVAGWFTRHGLPIPGVRGSGGIVPVPPVLWFDLTPRVLVTGLLIGLFVAVLASLYPAWRAARLDPVAALKEWG